MLVHAAVDGFCRALASDGLIALRLLRAAFSCAVVVFKPPGRIEVRPVMRFVNGVTAHPDYLPWFNAFAPHPETVLNDSNLDWGQDVLRLVHYVHREHIPQISLLLFTSADLDRLGFPPHKVIKNVEEIHGWFATSEMEIAIGETHSPRVKMWLDGMIAGKPYTRIGKSIRVYRLN